MSLAAECLEGTDHVLCPPQRYAADRVLRDRVAPPLLGEGRAGAAGMLAALIIVFREVIEAGLVVGIVLAATRGVPSRASWITIGIVAGLFGAAIVAGFADAIANAFTGAGQELLNAGVLILAVLMLGWHNV